MKKYKIKDATIAITYKCNARCKMCNIWQRTDHGNEISAEHFLHLPKSLKDVNLSGGEPFLRDDIVEIIKSLKKRTPQSKIIISSNGFSTELILRKMKEILMIEPKIGVAISLDGMSEKHNEIRGVESGFEKSIKTIKGLKELGVRNVKIAFTLGDYNYKDFRKVYNLSREMNVEFTMAVVHSAENYFGKENKIEKTQILIDKLEWLVKKEISSYKPKRWLRAYFTYGLIEYIRSGKRILPDYSGKANIFIDSKGIVYPCDVANKKIGKLSRESFEIKGSDDMTEDISWMICTARQAMKKHPLKVLSWVFRNKFVDIFWFKLFHGAISL